MDSDLQDVKIASNLGKSIIVYNNLVIIGDCALNRDAFVMIWMWAMTNRFLYEKNYQENKKLVSDLEKLNPHLTTNANKPMHKICRQVCNEILQFVQDFNNEEKYKTFVRVMKELAG
jgi:hypothetical protein